MNQIDGLKNQFEHIAACRCGWKGKVPTELVTNMADQSLVCPACLARFYAVPVPTAPLIP